MIFLKSKWNAYQTLQLVHHCFFTKKYVLVRSFVSKCDGNIILGNILNFILIKTTYTNLWRPFIENVEGVATSHFHLGTFPMLHESLREFSIVYMYDLMKGFETKVWTFCHLVQFQVISWLGRFSVGCFMTVMNSHEQSGNVYWNNSPYIGLFHGAVYDLE